MLGLDQYTRLRYPAGEWSKTTKGYFEVGEPTEETIWASVQPVTGEVVERLPEGVRSRDAREVFVEPPHDIRALDEDTQTPGDAIEIDGDIYRVLEVKSWPDGLAHHWALVARDPKGH